MGEQQPSDPSTDDQNIGRDADVYVVLGKVENHCGFLAVMAATYRRCCVDVVETRTTPCGLY
jgi:hypothetical protein